MAPTEPGAQVLAQGQVGRRAQAGGQYAARLPIGGAQGVDKPVEGRLLLHGGVQVAIVQQHGHPAIIKWRGLQNRSIQPAHAGTLLTKLAGEGPEQMGFTAAGLTPQVGRHRRAQAAASPELQVLESGLVGAGEKIGKSGGRCQADIQSDLLHAGRAAVARREVDRGCMRSGKGDPLESCLGFYRAWPGIQTDPTLPANPPICRAALRSRPNPIHQHEPIPPFLQRRRR